MNKHSGGDCRRIRWTNEAFWTEVTARAHKRLLALQLDEAMKSSKISKTQTRREASNQPFAT